VIFQRRGDLDFGLEIATARQEIGHRNDARTTLRNPCEFHENVLTSVIMFV
jgi:hypothetical protein